MYENKLKDYYNTPQLILHTSYTAPPLQIVDVNELDR
jgi:hypothetical protein